MASATLGILSKIFSLVNGVVKFVDLLTGGEKLTIADIQHATRGEFARFFNTIAYSDIEMVHRNFYSSWLPDVVESGKQGRLTPGAINNPGGSMNHTYMRLMDGCHMLQEQLNRLSGVTKQYWTELHLDERTHIFFAFMHGYGLLLHMHFVYAQMRCIAQEAKSLDDPVLFADTVQAQVYLNEALHSLGIFAFYPSSPAVPSYFPMGTPLHIQRWLLVTKRHVDLSRSDPGDTVDIMEDKYVPMGDTPSHMSLTVLPPPAAYMKWNRLHMRDDDPKNPVQIAYRERMLKVFARITEVIWEPAKGWEATLLNCQVVLNERKRKQQTSAENWTQPDINTNSAIPRRGEVLSMKLPVDPEEYLALSQTLMAQSLDVLTAQEDSTATVVAIDPTDPLILLLPSEGLLGGVRQRVEKGDITNSKELCDALSEVPVEDVLKEMHAGTIGSDEKLTPEDGDTAGGQDDV